MSVEFALGLTAGFLANALAVLVLVAAYRAGQKKGEGK